MKFTLLLTALLAAGAIATPLRGQQAMRLQLLPGSTLSIQGTSNLHGFTCKTEKMEAYIDVDPAYRVKRLIEVSHPIVQTRVVIPVKSLKCGDGKMDNNMYGALKADDNPTITFELSSYALVEGSASESAFAANTEGLLTIAGKEKKIAMPINAERSADGSASATGKYALLLTDFGIKPPKLMFGMLRVGNQILVKFNIKASASSVAYLSSMRALAER